MKRRENPTYIFAPYILVSLSLVAAGRCCFCFISLSLSLLLESSSLLYHLKVILDLFILRRRLISFWLLLFLYTDFARSVTHALSFMRKFVHIFVWGLLVGSIWINRWFLRGYELDLWISGILIAWVDLSPIISIFSPVKLPISKWFRALFVSSLDLVLYFDLRRWRCLLVNFKCFSLWDLWSF